MSRRSRSNSKKVDRPVDDTVLKQARRIARDYRIILEREPGGFLGRSIEMPSVLVHGPTPNACEKKAREALAIAIATMIEEGLTPPVSPNRRTAQVNIRLTAEEKLLLEESAKREGFRGISDFLRHVALSHTCGRTA